MDIRYIRLNGVTFEELRQYLPLLPPERQEKIARYRFEKDKLLSLVAGLLLRHEIGEKPVFFGDRGKPYANGVFFSLSHSGEIAAIATDSAEIGLDVEQLPDDSRLKIADRFYHVNERLAVENANHPVNAFARIWTRKEAYLKMTGEGISTDLTAFDTTAPPLSEQLYTVDLEGYCLSVCCEKPIDAERIYISEIELKELL